MLLVDDAQDVIKMHKLCSSVSNPSTIVELVICCAEFFSISVYFFSQADNIIPNSKCVLNHNLHVKQL